MISNGRKKGTLRFAFRPDSAARTVRLVGDFTGWDPKVMRRQKSGDFVANVELPPGTYEYKFLVDGQWTVDPDNEAMCKSPYGTFNSVASVP